MFPCIVVALFGLMLVRVLIIYSMRLRALHMCHKSALRIIDTGSGERYSEVYELWKSYGSFEAMLFNPRKWTFNSLYPLLETRLAEIEGSVLLEVSP